MDRKATKSVAINCLMVVSFVLFCVPREPAVASFCFFSFSSKRIEIWRWHHFPFLTGRERKSREVAFVLRSAMWNQGGT